MRQDLLKLAWTAAINTGTAEEGQLSQFLPYVWGIAVTNLNYKSLQTNSGNTDVKQPGSGTTQQIKGILRKGSFKKVAFSYKVTKIGKTSWMLHTGFPVSMWDAAELPALQNETFFIQVR